MRADKAFQSLENTNRAATSHTLAKAIVVVAKKIGLEEAESQRRREWEERYRVKYPAELEDVLKLARRAGVSPERILDGKKLTLRNLFPIIEGYLDRQRDKRRSQKRRVGKVVGANKLSAKWNNEKPGNPKLCALADALAAAHGSGEADSEIARKITGETKGKFPKAKSLLQMIRGHKKKKNLFFV